MLPPGRPPGMIATARPAAMNVPVKSITAEEAPEHFGAFALFAQFNVPASSARTQELFEWRPTEPGLIADLDQGHYYTVRDRVMH